MLQNECDHYSFVSFRIIKRECVHWHLFCYTYASLEGILGETLSKFSIWGLYITFVLAVGRFIRLQCSDLRMRIPFENLPSCDRYESFICLASELNSYQKYFEVSFSKVDSSSGFHVIAKSVKKRVRIMSIGKFSYSWNTFYTYISWVEFDYRSCSRLLAICEDIYAARAEGELEVEEVLYWTLVKIYRSPHMLLEYTKLD